MIWFLRRHPVYGSVDTEVESVWPAPGSADCQAASQLIAAFAKAEQELKRRTRSTSRVASNITISNESRRVPMHFTVSRTLFRLQVTTPRRSNSVSSFLRDRYLSIEEKECERACRRRVPNSLTAKSARRTGFPLRRAIEKEPLGSVCPSLERQPWFAGRLSKIEPRRGITRRWQTRARVSRNHRGRICPGARCWCTCCRCTSRTIDLRRTRTCVASLTVTAMRAQGATDVCSELFCSFRAGRSTVDSVSDIPRHTNIQRTRRGVYGAFQISQQCCAVLKQINRRRFYKGEERFYLEP